MFPEISSIVWGVLLPAVWAAVVWGGWVKARGRAPGGWAGVMPGVAVAGAFLLAFFAVDKPGAFPPTDAVEWLFYGGFAVALAAAVEGWWRPTRTWGRLAVWIPLAAGMVAAVSSSWRTVSQSARLVFDEQGIPSNVPGMSAAAVWVAVGGMVAAMLVLRAAVGRLGCKSPAAAVWVLGLTSAVSAVVMGMSGSQFTMPFRLASVGLALIPLLGVVLWTKGRDAEMPPGANTAWTMLWAPTLLAGWMYYDKLGLTTVVLLGLAPVAAALIPAPASWGVKATALRLAAGLAPLGVAAGLKAVAFARDLSDAGGY